MPLRAEGEGKGRSFLGVVGFSLMMVLKVVPDFRSTGIKGGKRAFEWCCIVRAVCTTDVMEVSGQHMNRGQRPLILLDFLK